MEPVSDESLATADSAESADLGRSALTQFVGRQFCALVMDPAFPCLGARSAVHREAYSFHLYSDMNDTDSLKEMAADLEQFGRDRPSLPGRFATFVASFERPRTVADAEAWDSLVWYTLQALHEIDSAPWDPRVTSDRHSDDFCFSFAGEAYFLVGLHPGASRHSRRFAYHTLVFNAHDQFEQLRHTGEFARFQGSIQRRDVRLQGSVNPKVTMF